MPHHTLEYPLYLHPSLKTKPVYADCISRPFTCDSTGHLGQDRMPGEFNRTKQRAFRTNQDSLSGPIFSGKHPDILCLVGSNLLLRKVKFDSHSFFYFICHIGRFVTYGEKCFIVSVLQILYCCLGADIFKT